MHSCGAELGGHNMLGVCGFGWPDVEATREGSLGSVPEGKALHFQMHSC